MMIKVYIRPRWRKILADLWGNRTRSLIAVASIAIGTFAVGLVASTLVTILTDMDKDYQSVNPHAAVIYSEAFDDNLLNSIRRIRGVKEAEGRSAVLLRILLEGDKKIPIAVVAIPPIDEIQIDRLRPSETNLPLTNQSIYIERAGLNVLPIKPGDTLTLETHDRRLRTLQVAGFVHDITSPPNMFSGQVNGYVTADTIEWLGGSKDNNQVYITVNPEQLNLPSIHTITKAVTDKIEKSGRKVFKTTIPAPGKYWASDTLQAMGIMMGFLGVLAVFLSAFLVYNTITALMGQQIRQIGIMKSIGGQTRQIIIMYLILIASLGLVALLIALPLSSLLAYNVAASLARFFNFTLGPLRISFISITLQATVALFIPLLAALIPIMNGTRLSVREALNNLTQDTGSSQGFFNTLMEKIRGLQRPLILSLRNAFRRKTRLALTLTTLTLGGSIFIAVFNLQSSLQFQLEKSLGYFISDVNITLTRSYRIQEIEPLILSTPGVVKVEGWGFVGAQILSPDKAASEEISLIAPPAGSPLIQPSLTAGRWLLPEDQNAIVIGNHLEKKRPDLKVGDDVILKIDGKESLWKIVGSYSLAGMLSTPLVYTNYDYLMNLRNTTGQASDYRIVTSPEDALTQRKVADLLDAKLNKAGVQVSQVSTGSENRGRLAATINILIVMLLAMALLIAFVGGLGLMGMMSMQVMERTREIGIMRAIGAQDGTILRLVITEGELIGFISWAAGSILAFPISIVLELGTGQALVGRSLPVVFSPLGFVLWLIVIVMLSALASFLPARNASRLTIREVLAYE